MEQYGDSWDHEKAKLNAVISNCVRGVGWGGMLIAALVCVMPDEKNLAMIEMQFPEQAQYMRKNLIYLIIEAAIWLITGLGYFYIDLAPLVGFMGLGWALYVTIWNFIQYSVVFDASWLRSYEWDNAVVVMKWIWVLRTIHGVFILIVWVGLLCGGAFYLATHVTHSKEERSQH